jgi:hypothetical protein
MHRQRVATYIELGKRTWSEAMLLEGRIREKKGEVWIWEAWYEQNRDKVGIVYGGRRQRGRLREQGMSNEYCR